MQINVTVAWRRLWRKNRSTMKAITIIGGLALAVAIVSLMAVSLRRHAPSHDLTSEMNVRGMVQEVQGFHCPVSGDLGTHLILQTPVPNELMGKICQSGAKVGKHVGTAKRAA
jgi:hypothetical protein